MYPAFVGVTGLPRAGSTLLCQLLAMHPAIHCEGHSSPLCNLLLATRRMVSEDQFMLAQLDHGFERAYDHLKGGMQGMLRGWYGDAEGRAVVIDKNRAWLHCIEMLLQLAPEARLIVCLRDLHDIYGSIEAQHQKTLLLDFTDHLADFDRLGRADQLFARDKVIGAPLTSLQAVQDLPAEVRQRLYFLRFEDLMAHPALCIKHLFAWMGIEALALDTSRLTVNAHESDSHYRMKFLHRQLASVQAPRPHDIPPRIRERIDSNFAWYYDAWYPDRAKLQAAPDRAQPAG